MSSPKTLALQVAQAHLAPRPIRLDVPQQPKTMVRGEYASVLRESIRIWHRQLREQRAALIRRNDSARGFERTTPTSGTGRRRAKALRNKRAGASVEA